MPVAASCSAPTKLTVRDSGQAPQEAIATGESLTFVSTSSSTPEIMLDCLEQALREEAPELSILPSQHFHDSMFPWFEPGTAPSSDEQLAAVMGNLDVQRRIKGFGLRYLIAVRGGTALEEERWGAGQLGGGFSFSEGTTLTTSILDLKSSQSVGRIAASGAGVTTFGLIVIVPYLIVAQDTEKNTCKALAVRIHQNLTGGAQPQNVSPTTVVPPTGSE